MKRTIADICCALAIGIAVTALAGIFFSQQQLLTWGYSGIMSAPTSVAIILIGIGKLIRT